MNLRITTITFLSTLLAACGGSTGRAGGDAEAGGVAGSDGGAFGGSDGMDGTGTGGSSAGGEGATGSTGGTEGTSMEVPKFDVEPDSAGGMTPTCDPVDFEVEPPVPQVGLLLDASGSMNLTTDFEGQSVSQWAAVVYATEDLLNAMSDRVDFGALYYPDDKTCGVSNVTVPVGPNDAATVLGALPPAMAGLNGATPTLTAVETMADHLTNVADGRPQAMVLLTDGMPNCSGDEAAVEQAIGAALQTGIPTYVVGFAIDPTINATLNGWAQAGGTAKGGLYDFYEAEDGDALANAFDQIIQDAIPCTLTLDDPPTQPEYVEVRVGGTKWPEVADCGGLPGWYWSKPYEEITLCGTACDQLKQKGTASVTYACPAG